jgi:hypothetical protein
VTPTGVHSLTKNEESAKRQAIQGITQWHPQAVTGYRHLMMTRTPCGKIKKLPIVQIVLLIGLILFASAGPGHSADRHPAPQADPSPNAPRDTPDVRPKTPPDFPPSSMDPGIVKQPETVPRPDAVVVPPVVDPGMAINPERQGTPPDGPPARDNPQDSPPPRQ